MVEEALQNRLRGAAGALFAILILWPTFSLATDYSQEVEVPRKALVMAVGDYEVLTKLPTARSDLDKIKTKLDELGFKTTALLNPTIDELWSGIGNFGN